MLRIVHDADTATPGIAPLDLDELCRLAAREMLALALEAERRSYLEAHAELLDAAGHRLVVGNGSARDRAIMTGAGMVEVRAPRVDDRRSGEAFRSALLPPYARRSPKVTEVLPILYLRGLSTGDFGPGPALVLRLRRRPQPLDDQPADRELAGRARGLERARPVERRLRLLVGRRRPLPDPPRGGPPVLPGHHRRAARRDQGARRGRRRLPGEHRVLGRPAARPRRRAASGRRSSRPATAPWASGPPSATSSPRPASRPAGSTRRPASSTPCRSGARRRRRPASSRSTPRRLGRLPSTRSPASQRRSPVIRRPSPR